MRRRAIATAFALAVAACGATPRAAVPPVAQSAEPAVVGRDVSPPEVRQRGVSGHWMALTADEREALYVRLATELAPRAETTFAGPLAIWPVTSRRITSPFGPRWGGFHTGLDIASPMGAPVIATAPGQVVVAGKPYLAFGDTATIVIVAHGSDFLTLYVHLDDSAPLPVTVGQKVTAGTLVGHVGLTGWTTGPHVHFMTVTSGRAVNPLQYLP